MLAAALLALVVVLTQIVNDPPAVAGSGGPDKDIGIWLALGGAGLMTVGAVLATTHISLAVEAREREPGAGAGPEEEKREESVSARLRRQARGGRGNRHGRSRGSRSRRSRAALTGPVYVAVVGPGRGVRRRSPLPRRRSGGASPAEAPWWCAAGWDGVMEAACRGAKEAGGTTVGLLPGGDRAAANRYVDVALPTDLGQGRNLLVVRAGDALVAVGGGHGTLSEIALALRAGKRVVGLDTWDIEGVEPAASAEAAVDAALAAVT